jgi:hypothetical protein
VKNEESMIASSRVSILSARARIVLLLAVQSASAEPAGSGNEQVEARRLERFLRENHSQAVARKGKGFSVEVKSGIITVRLSNDIGRCTSDGGVIISDITVDIRALRTDRDDVAERDRMTLVSFPFGSDATKTLSSAYAAHEEVIAEARAEHGWGLAAATAASKAFTERYAEALAIYREDFVHCSGAHTVQISDPIEWTVALQPSADASELVDLLRDYQASLSPEQAER